MPIFAGCQETHSFAFDVAFCHFCSFLENWGLPPTNGLKYPKTLSAFIDVVRSSASDTPVAYPSLSAIPPTPPPSRAQLRAARRLERKLRSLDKLNKHLETLESEGFLLIFTDGSSEHFPTVGWVGGYGVYSAARVEVADFVPLHMKQTINSAELLAALVALQRHADHPKIALCADSEYVLLGVKGAARRWKINGWRGSSGPISNVPLWEEVLLFSEDTFQEVKWVKVPSHVNVMGNEQANTLANQGRIVNPLYPVKGTPHGRRQHHTCTPYRTAKKPKLPARELSPIRPLALDFDGVADSIRHSNALPSVIPSAPPPCLSDLGLQCMPDEVDCLSPAHSVLTFLQTPSPTRYDSYFSSPAARQPSTSCSEGGTPPGRQPRPLARNLFRHRDASRSPWTSCSE